MGSISLHETNCCKVFWSMSIGVLWFYLKYWYFLNLHLDSHYIVFCFTLGVELFHEKAFYVFQPHLRCAVVMITTIKDWKIILDIPNDLKATICPSSVRFHFPHIFSIHWIFDMRLCKSFFLIQFFIVREVGS